MREFGVKESWTKLFSFSPVGGTCYWSSVPDINLISYFVKPFAYSNTGTKVLLFEQSRGLCCYNLNDLEFESIEFPVSSQHLKEVDLCVESLVALDAGIGMYALNGEQWLCKICCKRELEGGAHDRPLSVKEVFRDFKGRTAGIIKALTSDVKYFYQQCDPKKEKLCLYGFSCEQWEVNLPAQEVPTDLPEPVLGINVIRVGMEEDYWLSSIAVHSDAWLLAVPFFLGAWSGFHAADRKQLFDMINELPSVSEVVKYAAKENSSVSKPCLNKSKSNPIAVGSEHQAKYSKPTQPLAEKDEHDDTVCGDCGENYASDGFRIFCDICEKGFHGKCVKITSAMAEHIKLYKYPFCRNIRARA